MPDVDRRSKGLHRHVDRKASGVFPIFFAAARPEGYGNSALAPGSALSTEEAIA